MSDYTFTKAEIIKREIFPLKITSGTNKVTNRMSDKVRRVRLVGLIFDDKKKLSITKGDPRDKSNHRYAKKKEKAEILIVDHASAAEEVEEQETAVKISLPE